MEGRKYDLAKVRREMKKENFPERTKNFLERGGEPEVAQKAPQLVNEFWKYIVKPEIVNYTAGPHMGDGVGGAKKKSGRQLIEKSKKKKGESSGTEDPGGPSGTEAPMEGEPPRDERGRFVSYNEQVSAMGEPSRREKPTPPPKSVDVLLSTYGQRDPGDPALQPEKVMIKRKPKRKMEGITFEDIRETPVELVFKKKKKKLRQTNLYEYYPPIPPPKPKKGEIISPEAEDFPRHKGVKAKKGIISEKERARRKALSERMKVENKKKKKKGAAEFFKDEEDKKSRREEKEEE